MKAFRRSVLVALPLHAILAASLAGCAEDVETRPRQPGEVAVVEPVEVAPGVGDVAPAPAEVAPRPSRVARASQGDDALLETWASRNPDAARALGAWVRNNPEAAAAIFKWDRKHPGRSRELVRWAIHHPGVDISAFTGKHPDWSWFDQVMASHRVGGDQYLAWCRQYPAAAEELVQQSSGLRWVGDHLYAADWRPE